MGRKRADEIWRGKHAYLHVFYVLGNGKVGYSIRIGDTGGGYSSYVHKRSTIEGIIATHKMVQER